MGNNNCCAALTHDAATTKLSSTMEAGVQHEFRYRPLNHNGVPIFDVPALFDVAASDDGTWHISRLLIGGVEVALDHAIAALVIDFAEVSGALNIIETLWRGSSKTTADL